MFLRPVRVLVVFFFVGLAVVASVVVCAAWAVAEGRHARATMRSSNEGSDGPTRHGGSMVVAVVGLILGGLAVGLFAAVQIPDSSGPCGRDIAPSTKRHAVDPVEYEQANLEVARGVAQFGAGDISNVSSRSLYRCTGTVTSDVVGVTTSFSATVRDSSKCAYMNVLEADLRAAGWIVHSVETASLDGKGRARFTTAERGHQQLEIGIDGLGAQVHVNVDHDTGQNGSLSPDFPSSVCE